MYIDLIRYFHISKKNEEKKDNKLHKVFLFMRYISALLLDIIK